MEDRCSLPKDIPTGGLTVEPEDRGVIFLAQTGYALHHNQMKKFTPKQLRILRKQMMETETPPTDLSKYGL